MVSMGRMGVRRIDVSGITEIRIYGDTEASSMAADKRIHESTELRIYDNKYGRL